MSDFLHSNTSTSDVVDKIFRVVSKKYKVSPDDIKGKRRTENIASARHICIFLIRQLTDLSQSAIGVHFDRDHTTVIHARDKIAEGKKQYALSFVLQDLEKTLTDNDVERVMTKLLSTFQNEFGAVLR